MNFFILARTISVYSSTKCHVLLKVTFFFVHKIFTFYIHGVLKFKCPAPGPKGISQYVSSINRATDSGFGAR